LLFLVVYEWFLDCKNIGNSVTNCRWMHPQKSNNTEKEITEHGDKGKRIEKPHRQAMNVWQDKDNPSGIGSSEAFESPGYVASPTAIARYCATRNLRETIGA